MPDNREDHQNDGGNCENDKGFHGYSFPALRVGVFLFPQIARQADALGREWSESTMRISDEMPKALSSRWCRLEPTGPDVGAVGLIFPGESAAEPNWAREQVQALLA